LLELEFAQHTDAGKVRGHNEDFLGVAAPSADERDRRWLFALADGVGGQDRGEVASRAAVDHLLSGFRRLDAADSLSSHLPRLIQAANTHVFHAGDSRCYLIRQGQTRQLTRDHTVASEQAFLGLITAREAVDSGSSNLLSRSLGTEMFVSVETNEYLIQKDDVLLLCSDGLHNSVKELDIVRALERAATLESAAHELVFLAKERDGGDNISVQLIRIKNVERVGMYRGQPYRLP
jgi:serine/threonine protein phosphatase PrpC